MRNNLKAMGYEVGETETPIIPIIIGKDVKTFMFGKTFWQPVFIQIRLSRQLHHPDVHF